MAIKGTYFQGETLNPTLTDDSAEACVFKFWPVRSTASVDAATQMIANVNQSVTVGEISVSSKSADDILALQGIIDSRIARGGGTVAMAKDGTSFSASVDTSALYGDYQYVILATASGATAAAASGTFTVNGDPDEANCGGGIRAMGVCFR